MHRLFWFLLLLVLSVNAQVSAPQRVLTLQAKTAHVQGIDTDGIHLWVTSVERETHRGYLQQFAVSDGRIERVVQVQDGDRLHPGGIATDKDSIYVPVAEYKAASTTVVQKRSKRTLEIEHQFTVPDHIGCVAVTPEVIIGGNWDSRHFYIWDHAGNLIRKVASTTGTAYQDMKVVNGQLVASGLRGRQSAVDWLDLSSLNLIRRVNLGFTDRDQPFSREGMTIFENRLWLLPEDGESRLFIFDMTAVHR